MGKALWAIAAEEEAREGEPDPKAEKKAAKEAAALDQLRQNAFGKTRYQVQTFRRPRAPWRDSFDEAMQDAIDLDLASYDRSRRRHFIAVPVEIATWSARG